MLRGRNVIVFDLDGTLVDSAPDLGRGLNAVLAEEGRPPLSIPVIRELVARAAGVPAVLVSYGYSRVAPAELGADLLIDAIADLVPWLDQSPRSSAGP